MFAMVVNAKRTNWNVQLPHVESVCNSSVSTTTGVAPYGVHMDRLLRLSPHRLARPNIGESLGLWQLADRDLATGRQSAPTAPSANITPPPSRAYSGATARSWTPFANHPPFTIGGWARAYDSAATICQGSLKAPTLSCSTTNSHSWIAPSPAPASDTPDRRPLHEELFYLDLPSKMM